jgi:phosphopantetheine adenylyltransferase
MEKILNVNTVTESGKFENVIWEGRYQPIHKGHLSYIRTLLKFGKNVWITVNANEISSNVFRNREDIVDVRFSEIVDFHHQPEKNIIPFWLRYKMVIAAIHEEFGNSAPITIMSGRRLDLAWDLYKNIFPPDRVFITPLRDDFEDEKAKAWRQQGETTYRVDVSDLPKISGTMVREKLKEKDKLHEWLMPSTISLLKQNGFI